MTFGKHLTPCSAFSSGNTTDLLWGERGASLIALKGFCSSELLFGKATLRCALLMKKKLHLNGKSFTCPACFLKAYFWRDSSLLKNLWVSKKRQYVSFPGDRNRGIVSRLFPYSNYKLEMVVTNGRGDGPRSELKEFPTPEGGMFLAGLCQHCPLGACWERFGWFGSAEWAGSCTALRQSRDAAGLTCQG